MAMMQSLPTFQTLLGEALEVCIHQILYQRNLYPRDIFVATREYLGIRCYVANHESLAAYIVQTLDVAIPALCSGIGDKLSLVILDVTDTETVVGGRDIDEGEEEEDVVDDQKQDDDEDLGLLKVLDDNVNDDDRPTRRRPRPQQQQRRRNKNMEPKIVESYVFELDSMLLARGLQQDVEEEKQKQSKKPSSSRDDTGSPSHGWTAAKVRVLEQSLKNLLLKIITMEHTLPKQKFKKRQQNQQQHQGTISPYFSDQATFRLQLHTVDAATAAVNRNGTMITWNDCTEFQHAVEHGTWYQPEEENSNNNNASNNNNMAPARLDFDAAISKDTTATITSTMPNNLSIAAVKSVSVPECHLRMQMTVGLSLS
jgi:hypothetical protein